MTVAPPDAHDAVRAVLEPLDEAERTHFVLYIALVDGLLKPADLSPRLRSLGASFAGTLGLPPRASADAVAEGVRAYFDEEPVDAAVLAGFKALLTGTPAARRKQAAQLLDAVLAANSSPG